MQNVKIKGFSTPVWYLLDLTDINRPMSGFQILNFHPKLYWSNFA